MTDGAVFGLLGVLAAVAAALAMRRTVWVTRVASWSMAPTLRPADLLLTRRLRRSEPIERGAIVVLRSAELRRRVVKRVVGLPGESVVVDGWGVRVNGLRLAEPYVLGNGGPGGSFSVPGGAYLMLGDNRTRSNDSRSWRQPFVPRAAIEGRLIARRHHESGAEAPLSSRSRWWAILGSNQ